LAVLHVYLSALFICMYQPLFASGGWLRLIWQTYA
jgi:hypothetical protein